MDSIRCPRCGEDNTEKRALVHPSGDQMCSECAEDHHKRLEFGCKLVGPYCMWKEKTCAGCKKENVNVIMTLPCGCQFCGDCKDNASCRHNTNIIRMTCSACGDKFSNTPSKMCMKMACDSLMCRQCARNNVLCPDCWKSDPVEVEDRMKIAQFVGSFNYPDKFLCAFCGAEQPEGLNDPFVVKLDDFEGESVYVCNTCVETHNALCSRWKKYGTEFKTVLDQKKRALLNMEEELNRELAAIDEEFELMERAAMVTDRAIVEWGEDHIRKIDAAFADVRRDAIAKAKTALNKIHDQIRKMDDVRQKRYMQYKTAEACLEQRVPTLQVIQAEHAIRNELKEASGEGEPEAEFPKPIIWEAGKQFENMEEVLKGYDGVRATRPDEEP